MTEARGIARTLGPTTRGEYDLYRGVPFSMGRQIPRPRLAGGDPEALGAKVDVALEAIVQDVETFLGQLGRYVDDDGRMAKIAGIRRALRTGDASQLVTGEAGFPGQFAAWNQDGNLVGGEDLTGAYRQLVRSKTISSGVISIGGIGSPAQWIITVDTEGAAATDDLDTINGTQPGDFILLQSANASRDITLTDNGNMNLGGFQAFTLLDPKDKAYFFNRGGELDAISYRNN